MRLFFALVIGKSKADLYKDKQTILTQTFYLILFNIFTSKCGRIHLDNILLLLSSKYFGQVGLQIIAGRNLCTYKALVVEFEFV